MSLRRLEGDHLPSASRGQILPYGFGDQLLDVPGIPLQESLAAQLADNCGIDDSTLSIKLSGPDVATLIETLTPLLPVIAQIDQEWVRVTGFLTGPVRATLDARGYDATDPATHQKGATIYFLESRTLYAFLASPPGCRYPADALLQLRANNVAQLPPATVRLQDTRPIPGERLVTVEFDLARWFGGFVPPPPATSLVTQFSGASRLAPMRFLPARPFPVLRSLRASGVKERLWSNAGAGLPPAPPPTPTSVAPAAATARSTLVVRPSVLGTITADFRGLIDTPAGRYSGTGEAPLVNPAAVARLILEDTYGVTRFHEPTWAATRAAQAAAGLTWRCLWYGDEFETFRTLAGFCGLADLWWDDDGLCRYTFQDRTAPAVATITARELVGEMVLARIPPSATRLPVTWGDRDQGGAFTLESPVMQARHGVVTDRALALPYLATEAAARTVAAHWLAAWDHPRFTGTAGLTHWWLPLTRTDRVMVETPLLELYGERRVPWEIRGTTDRGDQRTVVLVETDPIETSDLDEAHYLMPASVLSF